MMMLVLALPLQPQGNYPRCLPAVECAGQGLHRHAGNTFKNCATGFQEENETFKVYLRFPSTSNVLLWRHLCTVVDIL